MIQQEARDDPCFCEQEIEEAILPQLGWRAEAAVGRACAVKGGVLADKVGCAAATSTVLAFRLF